MQLKIRLKTWPDIIVANQVMETHHHFYTLKWNIWFTKEWPWNDIMSKKPFFTYQCEWVTSLRWFCLSNNCSSWFTHRCFVFKALLWMELPASGSLMAISVAMTAMVFFVLICFTFCYWEDLSCLILFHATILFQHLENVWLCNTQKVHVFRFHDLRSSLPTWL